MNRYRGNAIAVGVLLIACTATSILSAVPLGSTLDHADYLNQLATSDSQAIWTALLEFAWAATGAGIAIALYPVIRRHNRALALGSVAGRIAEGVFVLIGALGLLVLLSVSQDSLAPGADAAAFGVTGDMLLAVRDWTLGFVGMLPFLTAALMYYWVLYRARLIPRWLSGWGLAGAVLGLAAAVHAAHAQDFGVTTVNTVLNLPIGLQEMVLAVWLLAKGFNPPGAVDAANIIRSRVAGTSEDRDHQDSRATRDLG